MTQQGSLHHLYGRVTHRIHKIFQVLVVTVNLQNKQDGGGVGCACEPELVVVPVNMLKQKLEDFITLDMKQLSTLTPRNLWYVTYEIDNMVYLTWKSHETLDPMVEDEATITGVRKRRVRQVGKYHCLNALKLKNCPVEVRSMI